jgi:hypothetical protein
VQNTLQVGSHLVFLDKPDPPNPKTRKRASRFIKEFAFYRQSRFFLILLVGSSLRDLIPLISLRYHYRLEVARILVAVL